MQKSILTKIVLFFLLLLSACKPYQNGLTSVDRIRFFDVHCNKPLKINYETRIPFNGKFYDIKGIIKTNEDAELFINGVSNTLGIELFRMHIVNDSILFLNKVERTYYNGLIRNYKPISSISLDACILSDLVFGRTNCKLLSKNNFCIDSSNRNMELEKIASIDTLNSFFYNTIFDSVKYEKTIEIGKGVDTILITYTDFIRRFQFYLSLSITNIISNNKMVFDITFTEVSKIKSQDFRFRIPSNFRSYD